MNNKEITILDQDLLSMIHKIYPEGVKYTNDVINLAVDLDKVSKSLYDGSVIQDYGIYPFLDVESICYYDGNNYSAHVIIQSNFDDEEFADWVNGLHLSNNEKSIVKNDVYLCVKKESGLLYQSYIPFMQYLIEFLKCMIKRREERIIRMNEILTLPVHYSRVVTFNDIFTKKYMMRKIRKYNRKADEKRFIIQEYPGLHLDKVVIVSCLNHMPK